MMIPVYNSVVTRYSKERLSSVVPGYRPATGLRDLDVCAEISRLIG